MVVKISSLKDLVALYAFHTWGSINYFLTWLQEVQLTQRDLHLLFCIWTIFWLIKIYLDIGTWEVYTVLVIMSGCYNGLKFYLSRHVIDDSLIRFIYSMTCESNICSNTRLTWILRQIEIQSVILAFSWISRVVAFMILTLSVGIRKNYSFRSLSNLIHFYGSRSLSLMSRTFFHHLVLRIKFALKALQSLLYLLKLLKISWGH